MAFLDYTRQIPLPAPVTTGGTQFYTDPNGDLWVARPGAFSGAWVRARGNLFCRAYRSAAYTLPASPNGVQIPMDTAYVDNFAMFASPNIVIPSGLSGATLWLCGCVFEVTTTAAAQACGHYLSISGGQNIRSNLMWSQGAAQLRSQSIGVLLVSPGNSLQVIMEYTTASLVMTVGDAGRTGIWCQYMGP